MASPCKPQCKPKALYGTETVLLSVLVSLCPSQIEAAEVSEFPLKLEILIIRMPESELGMGSVMHCIEWLA